MAKMRIEKASGKVLSIWNETPYEPEDGFHDWWLTEDEISALGGPTLELPDADDPDNEIVAIPERTRSELHAIMDRKIGSNPAIDAVFDRATKTIKTRKKP